MKLVKSSLEENKSLLDESSRSFLPSKEDKTFNAYEFLKNHGEEATLFTSIDGESLVGYISVLVKDKETIDIGPMYIKKDFQGKGYGKKQVELLIDWAKSHGYKKIGTKTWGKNAGSIRIFEGLGFKLVEVNQNTRTNGDSTIKYQLDL